MVGNLQEALVSAGLADKKPVKPSPSLIHHYFGIGSCEMEAQVRLYLPQERHRHGVTRDELMRVREHLIFLGFELGNGLDIEDVYEVVPGGLDERIWLQIDCLNSLTAGRVLEQLRAQPPPGIKITRMTTPGIRA